MLGMSNAGPQGLLPMEEWRAKFSVFPGNLH